jgi:hypothetical protein
MACSLHAQGIRQILEPNKCHYWQYSQRRLQICAAGPKQPTIASKQNMNWFSCKFVKVKHDTMEAYMRVEVINLS